MVLVVVLFVAYSLGAGSEARRERTLQESLQQARAEVGQSVDLALAQVESKLRSLGPRARSVAASSRDYLLGTASEMLRELLKRNPGIATFLAANPEKRRALEAFLAEKAAAGKPFDLPWDDGTHHFR